MFLNLLTLKQTQTLAHVHASTASPFSLPLTITSVSHPQTKNKTTNKTPQLKGLELRERMKIAVEGCCHGELEAIYDHIRDLENQNQYKVDLLLICGDFEATRNLADLQCMAIPDKYKQLGGFYK